jgi:hypothetical protein
VTADYLFGALGGVALTVLIVIVRKARGLPAFAPDPPEPPPGAWWWQRNPGFKVFLAGGLVAASGFAVALLVWKLGGAIIAIAGMLVVIAYKYPSDWRRPPWPPWPLSELTSREERA